MTIKLEDCGILKDEILRGVVNQLCEQIDRGSFSAVQAEARKYVDETAKAKVDEAISIEVENTLSHVFQPISVWGEPDGDPTTVRQLIEKGVGQWWTETVDSSGKPTKGYGAKDTRAEWIAKKMIREVLDKELNHQLAQIAASMKAEFKKAVAAAVGTTVERFLK